MIQASTREALRRALLDLRPDGGRLALVPTMGFLHRGHLFLVKLARERADAVAVSIFVNPLQFGPGEDLDRYPRDLERDLELLEAEGVDLVFTPDVDEMYPHGYPRVTVDPGPMAEVLCGAYRPGHFRGVLTVVARLLGLFRPDLAVFGQKDFQQGVLVRTMVQDLELGVDIVMGPVVRESDGLALSSRNVLLSPEERKQAVGLHQALLSAQELFRGGERSGPALVRHLARRLEEYPLLRLQYGAVVDPITLRSVDSVAVGSVMAVAAFCGETRLIDNHILTEDGP